MTSKLLLLAALSPAAVLGWPSFLTRRQDAVASYKGNPLADVAMWPNPYYAKEIQDLAIPKLSSDLAKKAAEVAKVPSFQWL